MLGITYKGKHSFKDFGLTIKSKEISPPAKVKTKETVPYMHGSYDFSNLYGEQTYEERLLSYTFNLIAKNKTDMNIKKIKILDWLLNSFKVPLKDDAIPGFYFSAECEGASFKENGFMAEITASFKAYPFKISLYDEGNIPWDDFNFELDYMQDTKFYVAGNKSVTIYNLGARKIIPTVICSAPFDVTKNGTTYKFNAGTTKDWRFLLDVGSNDLILNGIGTIEFSFRKEVL